MKLLNPKIYEGVNPEHYTERWCEEFLKQQTRQLTLEEAKSFTTCSFYEQKMGDDKELIEMIEKGKAGIGSIAYTRVKYGKAYAYELSAALACYLGETLKTPGEAVMYITVLQYEAHRKGLKRIGMAQFANLFPFGILTDEALNEMWGLQKLSYEDSDEGFHPDNLLDYITPATSIIGENETEDGD